MGAEALNYDYDVIDTPTETPTTDKIVRCFTDSELNDELANLLKDSLSGVRKANLEDHGLEIRKRNRELIIREKKKQKLLSIVELSMMIFVLLLVPVLGTVIVRETVYLWLYIITGPVAAYLNCQVQNVLTKLMTKKMMEQEKMKKNKPRWKDLPFYERFARTCKRNGSADWMVEHIRERGKQKEKEVNDLSES